MITFHTIYKISYINRLLSRCPLHLGSELMPCSIYDIKYIPSETMILPSLERPGSLTSHNANRWPCKLQKIATFFEITIQIGSEETFYF